MGRILDIDEIQEERRKACDYFFDESGSCYGCAFYCEECVYDDDGEIIDSFDVCYINDDELWNNELNYYGDKFWEKK